VIDCLQALGYAERTDFTLVSALFGFEKPAPEIFMEACRLAETAPHETMFVGDNLKADCEGARNAGLSPVWLTRNGVNQTAVPFPRITSLFEVERLLDAPAASEDNPNAASIPSISH
jgi:putative hydrolase of the HAD superfamily